MWNSSVQEGKYDAYGAYWKVLKTLNICCWWEKNSFRLQRIRYTCSFFIVFDKMTNNCFFFFNFCFCCLSLLPWKWLCVPCVIKVELHWSYQHWTNLHNHNIFWIVCSINWYGNYALADWYIMVPIWCDQSISGVCLADLRTIHTLLHLYFSELQCSASIAISASTTTLWYVLQQS